MTGRFATRFSALLLLALLSPRLPFAQGVPSQRIFRQSESAVEQALHQVHSSIGGQLPVLDGFVETDQPLDGYSRGYYQCSVQVTPESPGGTLVRVAAKITAWSAGSGSPQGAYRLLPSNGRLEADFLDRLQNALSGTPAGRDGTPAPRGGQPDASPAPAAGSLPGSSQAGSLHGIPPASAPREIAIPPFNAAGSASVPSANQDLMSPNAKRDEADRQKNLNDEIQGLEEIERNQIHPTNLAVVKRTGTSVLSRPEPGSQAILRARAGDEFEMLAQQGNWVHIRIAGPSRGWIQRSDVGLPGIPEPAKAVAATTVSGRSAFHVSREETNPFPGSWQPLHDKTVKIIWVEPTAGSAAPSASVKQSFAKSIFLKAYREIASANQPVSGVVIVFDSADGGQISVTLATLKEWQAGSLSEASFWKHCALDPPDLLQDSGKAAGGTL